VRFARYCPYPRLKDICHDDVTTKWDFQSHNILYVLDGVITPLRITRIANPVYINAVVSGRIKKRLGRLAEGIVSGPSAFD